MNEQNEQVKQKGVSIGAALHSSTTWPPLHLYARFVA